MKKIVFSLIPLFIFLSILKTFTAQADDLTPTVISLNGYRLNVKYVMPDGTESPDQYYKIKGVCWSPASPGSPLTGGDLTTRISEMYKWHKKDIQLMKEMGVNTVRTYHDCGLNENGLTILDEFYRNGIMVIMTIDNTRANQTHAQQVVDYYKDHPAILMWLIGNEWDDNLYGIYSTLEEAKIATQNLAAAIKTQDPDHPVASSIGYTNFSNMADIVTSCPAVDVWGINIYTGASFNTLINDWKNAGITKPVFMSEMGTDAFHTTDFWTDPNNIIGYEDQEPQANFDRRLWWELYGMLSADNAANVCLGGAFFEWNDEFWKDGTGSAALQDNGGGLKDVPDYYSNEEWYGIVDIYRNPRQVFYSLKELFTSYPPKDTILLKVQSNEGTNWSGEYSRFYKDNARCYSSKRNTEGGRGMHVVVLDKKFGYFKASKEFRKFDTYDENRDGAEAAALADFLASLDNGDIVMMSVCDSACNWASDTLAPARPVIQNLLGSTLIGDSPSTGVDNMDSWAIISVKGTPGTKLAEAIDTSGWADLAIEINADLDCDSDGVRNSTDLDDDNDGISDADELSAGMDPLDSNFDDDAILDGLDTNSFSPHLVVPDNLVVNAGDIIDITIPAVDKDANVLTFGAVDLPGSAIFDPNSGHLYWATSGSDIGTYSIKVYTQDSHYSDCGRKSGLFTITVGTGTNWTLNMTNMNWYEMLQYEIPAPYASSAAAACKMILNYIRDGAGEKPLSQYEIYEFAKSPQPCGEDLNPDEVDKALGHFDPYDRLISNWSDSYDSLADGNPFKGYNYTVDTYNPSLDPEAMNKYMRDICHWMAYTVTKEDWWEYGDLVGRPNTPAAVPIYGTYNHWVVIKGCVTSQNPAPDPHVNPYVTPDFTVYGFWIKDPLVTGIGQESYATAAECQSVYFKPLTSGDYNGLLVQVAEPPYIISSAKVKFIKPVSDPVSLELINNEFGCQIPAARKKSWEDLVDKNLLADSNALSAFKDTTMGRLMFVRRSDEKDSGYYLLPFNKKSLINAKLTSAVIMLDAKKGYFKGASWSQNPEKFLPINKNDALRIVSERLSQKENSRLVKRIIKDANVELVWEPNGLSASPYKPYWKIACDGYVWCITQDGRVVSPF